MDVLTWVFIGVASIGVLVLVHKFCLHLEKRGLLYYRKRPEGSGGATGGVLMELDKLARPSIEHVIQVESSTIKQEEAGIDGE